jgi:hypothetical protein
MILLTPYGFVRAAEELCGSGQFLRFDPDPMEDVPAAGRKALVVGVGTYESLMQLQNPANDARAVAAKLRRLGFGGACGIDVSRDAFVAALEDLSKETTSIDTAFVYFAGHGASVESDNYLALTNTSSHDPHAFKQSAVGVMYGVVYTVLTGRPRRLIVVTDACRNQITWKRDKGRRGNGVADSFVPAKIPLEDQDQDPSLFIGYGTGYGMWADDGSGTNGAFTAKLAFWLDRHIEWDLRDILEEVEDDLRVEGREQRPERVVYGFGDRFYPRPPPPQKFNQRSAQARQNVLTRGCKDLRLVVGAYEEWRDDPSIATDYYKFVQELEDCLANPPQPLLERLGDVVTVADASTLTDALDTETVFHDFTFRDSNSIPPGLPELPDFPLGGVTAGDNLPPPGASSERARIRFTASNEISGDSKRVLDGLMDRAGERVVTVAAVVPRGTFAAIEAHARIATVLENLTNAGTLPERIKLVITPSGLATNELLVEARVDKR